MGKQIEKPDNLVIHSKKSEKTAAADRANFYASEHGKHLMKESAKHQQAVQGVANDLMRAAAKEGRGLRDDEIGNALDNIEVGFSHRPAIRANSKSSSAVKRFIAKVNPETGRAEWVPLNP